MNEITPKFLICTSKEEIYILHRQYPACLIQVVQETPLRFVVEDLYDAMDEPNEILTMDFVQEAKDFFNKIMEGGMDLN